jgi:hypothetical protein
VFGFDWGKVHSRVCDAIRRLIGVTGVIAIAALMRGSVAVAAVDTKRIGTVRDMICQVVDAAAKINKILASFLTRILWQESGFRTDATSPAGAAGVAQFMPGTAAERGLVNPYDPGSAIGEAARLLAEFSSRFGNLGLAAAAYNGGAGRVSQWLHAQSGLSAETQLYVLAVTGRRVETWRTSTGGAPAINEPGKCVDVLAGLAEAPLRVWSPRGASGRMAAWQVRLDNFVVKAVRLRQERFGTAPLSDRNRAAEALCNRFRAMAVSCAVYDR